MFTARDEKAARWTAIMKGEMPDGMKDKKGKEITFPKTKLAICHCHFDEDDYVNNEHETYLKPDADPICSFDTASLVSQLKQELAAAKAEIETVKRNFTDYQYKKLLGQGVRDWPEEDISIGMNLRAMMSESAYDTVSSLFPIPSSSVIKRKISNIDLTDGIADDYIRALSKLSDSAAQDQLYAGLILDETALRQSIEYDTSSKQLTGHTSSEFGSTDDENPASKLLVVLLKLLQAKGKQVVAYFFTSDKVTGKQLQSVVQKIITEIESKTKYKIVFVSTDMCGSNLGMWKEFGATEQMPAIAHPVDDTRSLVFVPDASHLLKNIRNSLLTHNFLLPDGSLVTLAPFRRLFEKIASGDVTELVPFKSENLFKLNNFGKMKVKNVELLISDGMIQQLDSLAELEANFGSDDDSVETRSLTRFLSLLNKWFAVMQCTEAASVNALDYNSTTVHHLLKDVAEMFGGMCVSTLKSGKVDRKPIQKGMIMLSNASQRLSEHVYMHSEGEISRIALGHITSDSIENHFSRMRFRSQNFSASEVPRINKMISMTSSGRLSNSRNSTQAEQANILSSNEILASSGSHPRVFDVSTFVRPVGENSCPNADRDVRKWISKIHESLMGGCSTCGQFLNRRATHDYLISINDCTSLNLKYVSPRHGATSVQLVNWIIGQYPVALLQQPPPDCHSCLFEKFLGMLVMGRLRSEKRTGTSSGNAHSSMTHGRHTLINNH